MKEMTDINIVLDRSGSMSSCRDATVNAYNEFLEGQRKGPDEARISLIQFDHEYSPVYQGKDITTAPRLDAFTYVPRGSTALLDAIGRTVDGIGARLHALPESERPNKVVVVILTDGMENASTEYSRKRVFDMIKHQEDTYNWTFVYLGANQDSYTEAGAIGFSYSNISNYSPSAAGLASGSASVSRNLTKKIRSVIGGQHCNKSFYDPADQQAADQLIKDEGTGTANQQDQQKITNVTINSN